MEDAEENRVYKRLTRFLGEGIAFRTDVGSGIWREVVS